MLGVGPPGEMSRVALFDLAPITGLRLVDLARHFVPYLTHLDLATACAKFMHSVPVPRMKE
jgi:hypothetical protein